MQRVIVTLLVCAAAAYVIWSLSGRSARLAMLGLLEGALPMLRGPLAGLRRRLAQPSGCAACSSSATQPRRAGRPR